jgi:hypothetical protein
MSRYYGPQKINGYYRLAKIPIHEVFRKLLGVGVATIQVKGKTFKLNSGSARYHTFHKSLKCVSCGKVANVAYIEKNHLSEVIPHVNLYHKDENGKFTLFTKDHIIPKSKGGTDDLTNLQTMCSPCNFIKGNKLPGED